MDALLILDVVAALALFGVGLWLSGAAHGLVSAREQRWDVADSAEPELDATLGHAEVLVSWAEGTRSDWDRHVRPMLAREFGDRVGGRRSSSGSQAATGEFLFGPQLWPLVNPAGRFTERLNSPGPGRPALERILERLEAA